MDNKEVVEAFLGIVIEDLSEWVSQSYILLKRIEDNVSVAIFLRITTYHLRNVNTSIENIKNRINDLFLVYKELTTEHQLKLLSLAYFTEFTDKVIDDIKNISGRYCDILELAENQSIQVDDYITSGNQESIEFLKNLDDVSLLKILETGHLVGL